MHFHLHRPGFMHHKHKQSKSEKVHDTLRDFRESQRFCRVVPGYRLEHLATFGGIGAFKNPSPAPGWFHLPMGVSVTHTDQAEPGSSALKSTAEQHIVVADTGNRRIQVLKYLVPGSICTHQKDHALNGDYKARNREGKHTYFEVRAVKKAMEERGLPIHTPDPKGLSTNATDWDQSGFATEAVVLQNEGAPIAGFKAYNSDDESDDADDSVMSEDDLEREDKEKRAAGAENA